jgi:aspartate kinase
MHALTYLNRRSQAPDSTRPPSRAPLCGDELDNLMQNKPFPKIEPDNLRKSPRNPAPEPDNLPENQPIPIASASASPTQKTMIISTSFQTLASIYLQINNLQPPTPRPHLTICSKNHDHLISPIHLEKSLRISPLNSSHTPHLPETKPLTTILQKQPLAHMRKKTCAHAQTSHFPPQNPIFLFSIFYFLFPHHPLLLSRFHRFHLSAKLPRSLNPEKNMSIIVQKFGGTSVASAEKIHKAAEKVVAAKKAGNQVVVVVSAMGHTTDELVDLAQKVWDGRDGQPPKREMDQLLATGEQVTIALIAIALAAQGHEAISFTGGQIGLITDENFTKARVKEIDHQRIIKELDKGKIVIIAGFQGITSDGHVTTLGRGGSNATLVAIGAVLKASVCENFTDVAGIFTADPRIVPDARLIKEISYDEMMELSSVGASVLQTRAVEFAKKYNVKIHVRNSQTDQPGTMIVAETQAMEHIVVSGCALKRDLTRVTLKQVPDHPGVVATLFSAIGEANIVVDDIIQNVMADGTANISFTVEHGDVTDLKPVVEQQLKTFGAPAGVAIYDTDLAKVSVVGVGMKQSTGVAAKMFGALAREKINIQNISTSEIRISCIIAKPDAEKALRAVHAAFDLGKV